MRKSRNPETVHPPVDAYVHQIEVSGNLRWLNLSGQIGMTKDKQLATGVESQLELALKNISLNLTEAGMSIKDLTTAVFYFVDSIDLETRTKILKDFFGDQEICMTLIYVKGLATPEIKVEVDVWACQQI
ncbi:RidA family protein [Enterococcus rivorum]|uniref:Enamine deaminase RidA n=1 Tax=Enterococcus rivorum TaxID=762845 RepID=A0A1E5KXH6_9ENTE|nr:RidA family protein [Enterococcus rivorum]MBP2099912.1 enamine deaminase RidA (YjgF/YER057c/UK114 family) [Enterococcus rivorum]OEH82556.1 enamine deaminase RidA [Enterococcus rivorum]